MKKFTLLLLSLLATGSILAQQSRLSRIHKEEVRPADLGRNMISEPPSTAAPFQPMAVPGNRALLKTHMSSSLNVNGLFSYEERYVTVDQASGMFCFGNRAGGVFGNTGNDLKFKFMWNGAPAWDSAVIPPSNGKLYRYPSMILFNPANSTNPDDIYGIVSGPITEASWTSQYFGSIRLDGQYLDMNYQANEPNVYLNHMNIDLYASPGGNVTVASQRLNGATGAYTADGWEVLNGTFNAANHKVDWEVPFLKVDPPLKEDGRIDASHIEWSPDGSVGYLFGTAIDSNETYNPYGVEWPVIFKTTDHGHTWNKIPAFDFSTIAAFEPYLYPTRADTTKIIPRWYNKWASDENQLENGATVDMNGNLHIFSMLRSTMSLNPDSLNYFYTGETRHMFDIYMMPGGGWNAFYIDTLQAVNSPDPGTYGISWDHQTQITRTADGSKIFFTWTDTDPAFAPDNINPDIKAMGYDVTTGKATLVKNFTANSPYWLENWWMRVADEVYYDNATHTSMLPYTTSIPGSTNNDPLVHDYLSGCEIADNEFTILVGQKEIAKNAAVSPVSPAFPNPFREATTLKVTLDRPATVLVKLMSLTGQTVSGADYGTMPAGTHPVTIDGRGLVPGIYFYTVTVSGNAYSGKVMVQ